MTIPSAFTEFNETNIESTEIVLFAERAVVELDRLRGTNATQRVSGN